MPTDLSRDDIREIGHQVAADQLAEKFANLVPAPLPLTGWAKEAHENQEGKRLERVAAAQAEEERVIRAREAAAERKRQEREANAPARAKAQAELAEVEADLDSLDAQRDVLAERCGVLEAEARR